MAAEVRHRAGKVQQFLADVVGLFRAGALTRGKASRERQRPEARGASRGTLREATHQPATGSPRREPRDALDCGGLDAALDVALARA